MGDGLGGFGPPTHAPVNFEPSVVAAGDFNNLVDSNNQSFDVPAEDVRAIATSGFTQVVFRLPDGLAPGVCKVAIKAHSQTSNIGNITIAP